jgi:hypothetical protein
MELHVQKVPMRASSLLIWNSELPHCNYTNDSSRFRMVQYVKCFPTPQQHGDSSSSSSSSKHVSTFDSSEEGGTPAADAKGSGTLGASSLKKPTTLAAGLARRRDAITQSIACSFGSKEFARFDAHQRAMLGLQDYGSAGLRPSDSPTNSAAGVFVGGVALRGL